MSARLGFQLGCPAGLIAGRLRLLCLGALYVAPRLDHVGGGLLGAGVPLPLPRGGGGLITRAMERNEWGYNVRLLAHEDDRRLVQRFFGRAILAFLSAAIGLVSALLIGVSNGISVAAGVPLAQALGYLGLVIATVLGMRVLVAVIRDRVI
jgi:hypothetical protein